MQTLRTAWAKRGAVVPTAALGMLLGFGVAACGDDDDECGYIFDTVTEESDCEALQDQLDCASSSFDADAETCTLNNCGVCQDIDTDWDGDFDFDGDIDDDD
ncbi:MAG: hypothetical protein SF182_01405 [Deltaproteobacteria bacterium]|nr:hypothetical protein [Deltaproteobacteria bacterium]